MVMSYGQKKYTAVLPNDYNKEQTYPLFIVFHGGFSNMNSIAKWWRSNVLTKEYIVVYMEASTQDRYPDRWGWRDLSQERDNVLNNYSEIIKNYNVNKEQVYVGGFSLGARLSIDLVMNQTIPIKGFILLNHGGKLSSSCTSENIIKASKRQVRGVLITGENDHKYKSQTYSLKDLFSKNLLSYKFIVNIGVGHEEPKNFFLLLDEYLDYIK